MKPLIHADEISFSYLQNNRGLKPFSLAIEQGEGYFIHGPSGCGKSTLARCLTGMIPHLYHGDFQGEVLIEGQSTRTMELWQLSEKVGMVFQNPALQILAETVEEEIFFGLENLGLDREKMKEILEETLTQFNLQSFRFRSPHTLSGGEQQKLALAAIAARRPQLLVLDEPLSMLDTTASLEFITYLDRLLKTGTSAVICEHRHQYLQKIQNLHTIQLNGLAQISESAEQLSPRYPHCIDSFQLNVRDLSVQLGQKNVIDKIDFSFASGQIVAVVGRNGAGKTTLFRALMKLLPYKGEIEIKSESTVLEPHFNMIFQNPDTQLFNPTVRTEILYRIKEADLTVFEWLMDALDLVRYSETPPLLLSEGEKRRVALATALMHSVRHGILLDEPSLGQDGEHKIILLRLLKALAGCGYLIMISTHDLELAAQADKIMLLSDKGIEALGASADVIQDDSTWERIGLIKPEWMDLACHA